MLEYDVVVGAVNGEPRERALFAILVNERLSDGWRLHGSLNVSPDGDAAQAMVREYEAPEGES